MKKKFIVFFIMFVILIYSYKDKVIVGDNAFENDIVDKDNVNDSKNSKDNTIYVAKNIDDKGALIPYIMIEKYKGYSSPEVLLSELTTEIGKEYSDATITINLLSAYLGNKYTYGMQFAYTSNGHLVIDNRYAFLVNNSMYLVTTKEENVNTNEINNVSRIIIESLKEVN